MSEKVTYYAFRDHPDEPATANNDAMTGGTGADHRVSGDDCTADRATDFSPSQGDTKDNTTEAP